MRVRGFRRHLLALGGLVMTAGHLAAGRPPADIQLRVYRGEMADSDAKMARLTADAILSTAGITLDWADCTGGDPRCHTPPPGGTVTVRLLTRWQLRTPRACGESSRVPGVPGAFISIDVTCIRTFVQQIHFGLDEGDEGPRMTEGHVLGAVLAHELGHALGEAHSHTGLMRDPLTMTELRELVEGRLSFSDDQARRIRREVETLVKTMGGQG